jgi:hypothetical protein
VPGGAGDEADKPCADRSARRGTCSGRAGNRCTNRRPRSGQRIRVSRVESAKDTAANKEYPAQSGWRAGEILRFGYMRVVLDLSMRELRRLHHRPQDGSQRGMGHACGCPTLDPWAKSSGATGEPGGVVPNGDRQCECRRRHLEQNRRSTPRAGKPRTRGRAVGLDEHVGSNAGN